MFIDTINDSNSLTETVIHNAIYDRNHNAIVISSIQRINTLSFKVSQTKLSMDFFMTYCINCK